MEHRPNGGLDVGLRLRLTRPTVPEAAHPMTGRRRATHRTRLGKFAPPWPSTTPSSRHSPRMTATTAAAHAWSRLIRTGPRGRRLNSSRARLVEALGQDVGYVPCPHSSTGDGLPARHRGLPGASANDNRRAVALRYPGTCHHAGPDGNEGSPTGALNWRTGWRRPVTSR